MNKIILKGRLTNNVNVKYAENDNHTALAIWNMAVDDRSWKQDDGSYHTDYIPCFAIGKTAEIAGANLCKGKEVLLYGKMQSGSYTNKVLTELAQLVMPMVATTTNLTMAI